MTDKSTPKAVRDIKATEVEGSPKPQQPQTQQIQIHQGNIGTLTVSLLAEISKHLNRIANALEKNNG